MASGPGRSRQFRGPRSPRRSRGLGRPPGRLARPGARPRPINAEAAPSDFFGAALYRSIRRLVPESGLPFEQSHVIAIVGMPVRFLGQVENLLCWHQVAGLRVVAVRARSIDERKEVITL
jgi:hypothetical protein